MGGIVKIGSGHNRIDFTACLTTSNTVIEACGFSGIPFGLAIVQFLVALVVFLFLDI